MIKLNEEQIPILQGSIISPDGTPYALGFCEQGAILQSAYADFAMLVEWEDMIELINKPQSGLSREPVEIPKPKQGGKKHE